jgi:arginine N-succinyltransferase
MVMIRPVKLTDLDELVAMTALTGHGLTTLPQDTELLRKRILRSQRSFATMGEEPAGELYLFVMEDVESGRAIGTSGICSKVGGFEPFYAYRIETSLHESSVLGVHKQVRTLHLVSEHNGPTEIGTLFLRPEYRKEGNGRLLSLSRFLFMAEHSDCFDARVIAEMRGVIDDQGRSPFWDALGRHFFDIDLPTADYLSMVNKRFIADLMPKHPIYIPLLPSEAQAVIGQVHEQTRPALRLLQEEGFTLNGMVDIFEAGPEVVCPLAQIRTASSSRKAPIGTISEDELAIEPSMIATTSPEFRACRGSVEVLASGALRISSTCARLLGASVGDIVRFAPFRPLAAEVKEATPWSAAAAI